MSHLPDLQEFLAVAEKCAQEAGDAIRHDFGKRLVTRYKGLYDVQLDADLVAQDKIVSELRSRFSTHRVVSEEGLDNDWRDAEFTWVVDPLDGTNNFGYGLAHCAVSLALFAGETVVLSVVFDPIVSRKFSATVYEPLKGPIGRNVELAQAHVSLVTNYSQAGRVLGQRIQAALATRCKRVLCLWAPALDLALVATGAIDAMVCRNASILDVCAGAFLVTSAGGVLLGIDGANFEVTRGMHSTPISFVAARDRTQALELLNLVHAAEDG